MRVLIQHRSRYLYPQPSLLGPQTVRLRPADHARARIESYTLTIAPAHRLHWQRDPHGNRVARATFPVGARTAALEIAVELAVDLHPVNPFDFFVDDRAKVAPFSYPDNLGVELEPYLDTGDPAYRCGREATAFLKALPWSGDTIELITALNAAVRARIAYVIRDEPGVFTPEETVVAGRGSCRDVTVLLVALLRARGIAARFASGYLVQLADEGMIPDEPRGVSRDVVDLHAWAEAFIPGAGWIGLDATSGLLTGEGHIPLACTASPAHAAPLDGTTEVGATSVEFSATIARLGHEVRPTAPYTEAVWTELLAGGDRADAALVAAGLDVTVGGEPTFVARDGQAAEEWQGGALGPDKWRRGQALAEALRARLAPGGVVVARQGKHYPGEPLPRWALDVIARGDGAVLWPARPDLAVDATAAAAKRFGEALAGALAVGAALHPAYEDPWEAMKADAALPIGVETKSKPGVVVGYALPLGRAEGAWRTETWKFRRGELYLVPGDSPVGLRLPLASLVEAEVPSPWADAPAWDDPRRREEPGEVAGHGHGHPEGAEQARAAELGTGDGVPVPMPPPRVTSPIAPAIRTALAIEPRAGELVVFLPPVPSAADYLLLLAALDQARTATGLAIRLEGYPPPPSPVLRRFAVTPDPGVLEVNLPPARSCREAAELHDAAFTCALGAGLTSERYLLDGRMAGSGGGNHITLGAPTPAASPWLQRPSLLASLVGFAQHHPSLSYMFSGLFVGPTSQAPRVDEARHDALYELELALPKLHETGAACPPPWQVDALLRNLLVDVAGSTHRAEISIDKLCDPGTPFGRQGLVELRAFEMPPHPRMAAAQVVLVRALLAAFAAAPYRHALVRWGSELHDRFLLPYWMWRDFEDVLAHLAAHGVALPAEAYAPFVELRCPLVGELDANGATVEVRNAIEPWHVLGEETTPGGTARYVDSSNERLEIRARGLDPERYVVTVNGAVLPMRAGAGRDVRVGGVRFRAWCPPHALHPHLGIHHPVRIDVVDAWAERGVAGGAYHVWHPEGQAFDAAPLTRVEASARRAQRFTLVGPSPWPVRARATAPHPEQPYTLDLRRLDAGQPLPRAEDWIVPS